MQAAEEFASEGLRLGRADMQAHDFAFAVFAATAIMAATLTMRPP